MIDYRIMGVPKRMDNIRLLQEQLNIDDSKVFLDTKYHRNPMWTWKQTAQLPTDKNVTHLCIVQDDAVLCNQFREFCEYLSKRCPDAIFKLYNYKNLDMYLPKGCIFTPNCNIGGVATIIPYKYIQSIIEQQEKEYPNYIHDDDWLVYWAHWNNVKVYNTYPSIVDTFEDTEMNHKSKKIHTFCLNPFDLHWADARDFILSKKHDWTKLPD